MIVGANQLCDAHSDTQASYMHSAVALTYAMGNFRVLVQLLHHGQVHRVDVDRLDFGACHLRDATRRACDGARLDALTDALRFQCRPPIPQPKSPITCLRTLRAPKLTYRTPTAYRFLVCVK